MHRILGVVLVLLPLASAAAAEPESRPLRRVATYVPSRLLDLLDVVRLRVRVGPGTAFGARATEAADVFVGAYTSVYVGLPGPRGRMLPRLPAGIESRSGAEVSAADLSTGAGLGPDYSSTECGIGVQLGLFGADAGIDPIELIDFVVGLFGVDLRADDL
jgi:hypothetical protein